MLDTLSPLDASHLCSQLKKKNKKNKRKENRKEIKSDSFIQYGRKGHPE